MKEQKWLNLYPYILGPSLSSVTQLFIKRFKNYAFFLKKEGICTFLFWCKIKGSKDPGIGVKIPAVLRKLT